MTSLSLKPNKTQNAQRGVALITAMLIAALVSVAAAAMASRQTLDMRRTGNMLEADQAYMYALSGEDWVKQILIQDKTDSGDIDTLNEDWAAKIPPIPLEGGSIAGEIEDMQGRFNLNNLVGSNNMADAKQVKAFQTMLNQINKADENVDISPFVANRVVDWIDKDDNSSADGAEDLEYLGADVPYRAANRFMVSPSELGAIKDLSIENSHALFPFVSALPLQTPVNVNTAKAEVLLGLHEDITRSIADGLVEFRKDNPFKSKTDFEKKLLDDYNITVDNGLFDIKSEFFLVTIDAMIGRTQLRMYSLLERRNADVITIRRSIGTI